MTAMEQQQLRDLLETLHKELEQVGTVDEKTAGDLATLREDIAKLTSARDQEGLQERLNEAMSFFEEEHPKLSILIQHVLDSLSRMGF